MTAALPKKIRRLDEATVVRIAAGEVIERPASVVKELVENALDAGARNVSVRIERGGLGLIEVVDDGCGIPAGELPVAIERHATSKISTAEDLSSIRSMGFRGEALAAIASAGRLAIVSRAGEEDAAQIALDPTWKPGEPVAVTPAARARGTTVVVRDLFLATPARLKFMKSESTEFSRICDRVERLALGRPDVAVELMRDGKRVFRTSGRGDLREVVAAVFGAELARELLEASGSGGSVTVRGLCSPPHVSRRNRTGIYFDLAGRSFEDRTVMHAAVSAYEGLLPSGSFPVIFLSIDLPPSDVDVNVHPAKAEVRFLDPPRVHRIVGQVLRSRLRGDVAVPRVEEPGAFTLKGEASTPDADDRRQQVLQALFDFENPSSAEGNPTPDLTRPSAGRRLRLRPIGEMAGRFVLAEAEDGLYIIDQHAAHERVLFDRLMREAQEADVKVSDLLSPAVIEASAAERSLAEECRAGLAEIGFEIEVWPDAIAVKALPAALSRFGEAERIIRETIASLKEAEVSGSRAGQKVSYERLAREACKAAVKGTERLRAEEVGQLVEDLLDATDPYNCPHGRPTMIRLTTRELDRRFGRS